MTQKKSVSSKTHTPQQLNDYANQRNSNSKAFRANAANRKAMKSAKDGRKFDCVADDLEWFCYSNPYDFI